MSARAQPERKRGAPQAARRATSRVRTPPPRKRAPGLGAQVSAGIGRAVRAIPISAETRAAIRRWTLGLFLTACLVAGVIAMGLPQMAWLATAHALGSAGLKVRNVEIEGREHVDRDAVTRVLTDWQGQDLPLVDLAAIRKSLLGLGWVEDARVSRRLPDTLVVNLVERAPSAVWQYHGKLVLVDATGNVVAPVDPQLMPHGVPLLVGPGANAKVDDFLKLIDAQPSLKPLILGGTWVGARRWDILFRSGETLALPEGAADERDALALFARKDSEAKLLGQGIVRFDMRDPTRIVVRVSKEPGSKVDQPDAPKADAPKPDAPDAKGTT